MEYWNIVILIGALMLVASIVASVISTRVGVPLLLVFLLLGMLAGEDGPGGIVFNDFEAAYVIGTLALAVIIFDGGLRTRIQTFRVALWPAVSLATVGVAVTAGLLGFFAAWLAGLTWMEGLLLGAIMSSTDAAAVFATLRTQSASLKQRVGATLEIESGSNDPMAIFLTVGLLELMMAGQSVAGSGALTLAWTLVLQFAAGAACGFGGGRLLGALINRMDLITGFYPLLAAAGGIVVFAVATQLGGSGFLAIYIAGVVLGNMRLQSAQNILRVHDGLAWLSQIAMFLILGLLVTPSQLLVTAGYGLAIGLFLMFVARPIAVAVSLAPFHFPWREQVYLGWIGLRGAVPIVLATFPVMYGVENPGFYFNIAFFVVLVSLLLQGLTVSPAARWLGLEVPPPLRPAQRVTLDAPGHYEHDLIGFPVHAGSRAAGLTAPELLLPEGASLCALLRDGQTVRLDSDSRLQPGDFACIIARPELVEAIGALFDPHTAPHLTDQKFFGEFTLEGSALLGEVAEVYGIDLPPDTVNLSLHEYISRRFHRRAVVGDSVGLGAARLVVRKVQDGRILLVGLRLPHA